MILSYFVSDSLYNLITIFAGFPLTFLIVYLTVDKNICRSMTTMLIYELLHAVISIIISLIFTHIFNINATGVILFNESMLISDYINGFIYSAVCWLPSLYAYYLLRRLFRVKKLPQKVCVWATLIVVMLIPIELYTNIYAYFSYENIRTGSERYFEISLIVLVGVLIKLVYDNYMKKKMQTENAYLEQLNELQFRHYNELDNAISSAEKCENKSISIKASESDEKLVIICENSCKGKIEINSDNTIKTSKNDALHHGFGTKIIKSSAEKYGGCILCRAENDVFTYTSNDTVERNFR